MYKPTPEGLTIARIIVYVVLLGSTLAAFGQDNMLLSSLPPTPQPVQKSVFHVDDYAGIVLLTSLHLGDIVSTREFMHDPCKCMHEINPIAPHTPNWGAQLAYHGAWVGLNTWATYRLEKRHHRVLAWELRGAQIGVEAFTVNSNYRLMARENKAWAAGQSPIPTAAGRAH